MSAWDDPITHIRELEAEVSRLRKVVARVEKLPSELREMAVKEFTTFGPLDPRGAAIWDAADWLDLQLQDRR